jgi:hypothetical protein
LVIVAGLLAVEVKSLLIGETPTRDLRPGIEEIVRKEIPGGEVLRLIALQTGVSEILVAYKVTRGDLQSSDDLIHAINRAEKQVKLRFPEIRWQFVEPDFEA